MFIKYAPYHTIFLLYHTISTSLINIPLDQLIHVDPINKTYVWTLKYNCSPVTSYQGKHTVLHLPSLITASTGFRRRTVQNFMLSQELYTSFPSLNRPLLLSLCILLRFWGTLQLTGRTGRRTYTNWTQPHSLLAAYITT